MEPWVIIRLEITVVTMDLELVCLNGQKFPQLNRDERWFCLMDLERDLGAYVGLLRWTRSAWIGGSAFGGFPVSWCSVDYSEVSRHGINELLTKLVLIHDYEVENLV
ncbi:hypothetical protein HAX54_005502 [Datura stramonium]|uniref:Uncharacterized protein n=1 Tax=Datura stramonium TaxID=4076 RepID=A0ABS8TAB4_DATST|nr:hypothetical protein [Datura stramonium]